MGPQGVGNAVNETVVFTFLALFVINVFATAIAVKEQPHEPREPTQFPGCAAACGG